MIFLIILSITLTVISQFMLKYAMMKFGEFNIFKIDNLVMALSNPWVIGGILLYGCSTILWLKVLTRVELSYAYSMGSLSFILIALFGWMFFKEQVTALRLLGILFICIGVYFVSKS